MGQLQIHIDLIRSTLELSSFLSYNVPGSLNPKHTESLSQASIGVFFGICRK